MRTCLIGLLALGLAGPVVAAPAACASYDAAVQRELKEIAFDQVMSDHDSGAAAIQRAAALTFRSTVVQTNVSLMIAAGCPLPAAGVDGMVYRAAVIRCINSPIPTTGFAKSQCDRAGWEPSAP